MRLLLLAILAGNCLAQPFIFYRGIVSSSSFAASGLPNGSIPHGSIFSIFGRGIGPATPRTVPAYPLATTFEGVAVSVCQGGICAAAIPRYVSEGLVNVIMPSDAPLGPVSIRVTFNGQGGFYQSATVIDSVSNPDSTIGVLGVVSVTPPVPAGP